MASTEQGLVERDGSARATSALLRSAVRAGREHTVPRVAATVGAIKRRRLRVGAVHRRGRRECRAALACRHHQGLAREHGRLRRVRRVGLGMAGRRVVDRRDIRSFDSRPRRRRRSACRPVRTACRSIRSSSVRRGISRALPAHRPTTAWCSRARQRRSDRQERRLAHERRDEPSSGTGRTRRIRPRRTAGGWDRPISVGGPAASALAAPANYVELTFTAIAGVPYRTWFRMSATANSKANDSVWAQVLGSTHERPAGLAHRDDERPHRQPGELLRAAAWRPGGGWTRRGGRARPAPSRFATTGVQTLRAQTREDGVPHRPGRGEPVELSQHGPRREEQRHDHRSAVRRRRRARRITRRRRDAALHPATSLHTAE